MHKGLVGIAFLGLIVSGYLFISYTSSAPITCISGEGCTIVRLSEYSSFFGIPTPTYGIIYYLALGILASLWQKHGSKTITVYLTILTSIGLAISIFLTYLEAFVVQAWCSWCVVSAILTLIAFIEVQRVLSRDES